MEKLICVVGTNASGKSGLGVQLAKRYGGEIVSADSRQVYRGLDLGSGKITAAEMQGVPHHLLDVCDAGEFFSMADFQRMAYAAIDDILARGKQPFLVGGTGLYVSAVAEGYVLSGIQPDLSYRRELETLATDELYRMAKEAVPNTQVDPANRNRVMRVLEKLHDGDTLQAEKRPRYEVLKLGVTWPREVLCARIDERLARRMDEGMLDEVRGLTERGVSEDFLRRLGLEYRYLSEYLVGKIPSEEMMLEELAKAIKRFAKRQMTWFRRDEEIHWLDMAGDVVDEAGKIIDEWMEKGKNADS